MVYQEIIYLQLIRLELSMKVNLELFVSMFDVNCVFKRVSDHVIESVLLSWGVTFDDVDQLFFLHFKFFSVDDFLTIAVDYGLG